MVETIDAIQVGRTHLNAGRTREAADSFSRAAREGVLAPGMLDIAVSRMLEMKDPASAIVVAASALMQNPNDGVSLSAYGRALMAADLCALAEPALRAAYATDQGQVQLARMLSLCLLRLRKFSEARMAMDAAEQLGPKKSLIRCYLPTSLLQEAVTAESSWGWAAYQLGLTLFESRKFVPAAEQFRVAVEGVARGSALHGVACAMYADCLRRNLSRSEAPPAIKALLEEHATGATWDALYGGLMAFTDERMADAERMFAKVNKPPAEMLVVSTGASTFTWTLQGNKNVTPPAIEIFNPGAARENDSYIIAAAADGRYVCLFAETFISSILHVAGNRHIHIHIVNPTPESNQVLDRIRGLVPWLRLSTSYEEASYPSPRPYFATARFLVAPQLLDIFKRPLVIMDIDAVLAKDIEPFLGEFAHVDVSIKRNASKNLEFPWTSVFATFSVYMATPGAHRFLSDLADYFWDRFDVTGATDSWWIDQNALYYAVRRAKTHDTCRIIDLADTKADHLITANLPMEPKDRFIERIRSRFPLSGLSAEKIKA